jgi:hypothetical protein
VIGRRYRIRRETRCPGIEYMKMTEVNPNTDACERGRQCPNRKRLAKRRKKEKNKKKKTKHSEKPGS